MVHERIRDMPPASAFLLSVANMRPFLINGLLEEVLAILEEKKEMSGSADSATLLALIATLANDPTSKASK